MFVSILVFRVARLHSAVLPVSQGSPAIWLLCGPLITRSPTYSVSSSLLVRKVRSLWASILKCGPRLMFLNIFSRKFSHSLHSSSWTASCGPCSPISTGSHSWSHPRAHSRTHRRSHTGSISTSHTTRPTRSHGRLNTKSGPATHACWSACSHARSSTYSSSAAHASWSTRSHARSHSWSHSRSHSWTTSCSHASAHAWAVSTRSTAHIWTHSRTVVLRSGD